MGLEQFTDILMTFMKAADPPAVIIVLVLTFVALRAIWMPHGYSYATLSLVSLAIAVPVTYIFSVAEEATWGGRYIWRASLQNGAVSVVLWHLAIPQVFKRWPGLLKDGDFLPQEVKPVVLLDPKVIQEEKLPL